VISTGNVLNRKTDKQPALRLNHYLSVSGCGSRRACEGYIREGRVAVNGIITVDPSRRITAEEVTLDGKKVSPEKDLYYIALYKPRGYLCSSSDPRGRPLAVDLVTPHVPVRLFTIGRLDFLSSGIILLTNDGHFSRHVAHPSSTIEKEYIVETKEPVPRDFLEQCRRGIKVEGISYKIKRYEIKTSRKTRLVLVEGKNREIRKLFSSAALTVKRLHRTRIGPVYLGSLKPGGFRHLKPREIKSLMGSKKQSMP